MAQLTGPDWQSIAAAHEIDLPGESAAKLTALWRAMLGLRGLIDWSETPIEVFHAGEPRQ